MSKQTRNRRADEAAARLGGVGGGNELQAAKEAAIRRIPLDWHRFIVYDVDHVIRDGGAPTEDELQAREYILREVGWPGTEPLSDFERRWLDSWWDARQAPAT